MTSHPTARKYADIILKRLPREGPMSLMDLYRICEAANGGDQHFVREAARELVGKGKLRRIGNGVFAATEAAIQAAQASSAEAADPGPSPEAATTSPESVDVSESEPSEDPPSAIPAEAAPPDRTQEPETMQTQTSRTKTRRNGAATPSAKRTGSKMDWVIAAVTAAGTAKFSDLFVRAKKEGIYDEAKQLGATLCGAVKNKRLQKVARGIYAAPGAKVLFDATKTEKPVKPAAPKRTVEDVKRAVEAKKPAPPKPAPTKKAKPGRKPSVFRTVYDGIEAKVADARAGVKAADEEIAGIDRRIEELRAKRAEIVEKRDASRVALKRLDAARQKIGGIEAEVAASLKD